jgi:methylthioribose-1-phosphate isomerase
MRKKLGEKMEKKNIMDYNTVDLDDKKNALVIIDQTKLPNEIEFLELTNQKDIFEAIYLLKVRGAPAIGIAAAIGIYLAAKEIESNSFDDFYKQFKSAKDYLASSRPTAVNLFWALDRMDKTALKNKDKSISNIKKLLHNEAMIMKDEDINVCKKIGENGLTLIKDGLGVLTHCNAGQLAAVKYGTALAPIHLGRQRGMNFKVFADETRPLLQGARLTAFELSENLIDVTVICDNMVSQVMKNGWVQIVFTGADRIASNGDACNKIGTSGAAILAKYYNIPFYICAPLSTFDMTLKSGAEIPIEQRPSEEVSEMWYKKAMTPKGVKIYNPAFDVTDNSLITGIITEYGIAKPPYNESLKKLFEK